MTKLSLETIEKMIKQLAPNWSQATPEKFPKDQTAENFREFATYILLKQFKEEFMVHQGEALTADAPVNYNLTVVENATAEGGSAISLRCTRYGWPGVFEANLPG